MDKSAYLARKQSLDRESLHYKRENTCYTCFWLEELCLCPLIEPFATDTRFVILMHPKEAKTEKLGTGRICRAALLNSEIIVGIDFTKDPKVNAIIEAPQNHCLVLYPGENSLNISTQDVSPLTQSKNSGRKLVVFLIDGTWTCAKKMMTQSRNIRGLPRVSFSASHESIFEIKQQPAVYCLSTLESIHFFLTEADRVGLESLPAKPQDNLIRVFKFMIDFMLKCARDPDKKGYRRSTGGYTSKTSRKLRKKSGGRSIILLD